jgi:hypothetical protein
MKTRLGFHSVDQMRADLDDVGERRYEILTVMRGGRPLIIMGLWSVRFARMVRCQSGMLIVGNQRGDNLKATVKLARSPNLFVFGRNSTKKNKKKME